MTLLEYIEKNKNKKLNKDSNIHANCSFGSLYTQRLSKDRYSDWFIDYSECRDYTLENSMRICMLMFAINNESKQTVSEQVSLEIRESDLKKDSKNVFLFLWAQELCFVSLELKIKEIAKNEYFK